VVAVSLGQVGSYSIHNRFSYTLYQDDENKNHKSEFYTK